MTMTTQERKFNPTARILITEACLAKSVKDAGLRHCEVGEEIEAPRDVAVNCVYAQKAVFLDAVDDYNRHRANTVTEADRARVDSTLRMIRQRAEERAAQARG